MDRLPVPSDSEQPSDGTSDKRGIGRSREAMGGCSDRGEEVVEGSVESVRVRGKFCRLTVKLLGCVFLGSLRLQMERRFSRGSGFSVEPNLFLVIFIFSVQTQGGVRVSRKNCQHLFYFVTVSLGRLLPTSCDVRDSVSASCRCRRLCF